MRPQQKPIWYAVESSTKLQHILLTYLGEDRGSEGCGVKRVWYDWLKCILGVANLQDQCFMHLTNYSVNKHSDSFDNDESVAKGSKR